MENKTLKSFDELSCLLSVDEQEKYRKDSEYKAFVNQNWPYLLRTERRLLPLLPKWMRNKLTSAKELFDNCNTGMGNDLIWNHTITLPLNEDHEITFAILDNRNVPQRLEKSIDALVQVYEDLQVLYAKYAHPLTVVSMQTDDFGMFLPDDFFDPEEGMSAPQRTFPESCSIQDAIQQIIAPRYSRMTLAKDAIKQINETSFDEHERIRYNTWFACQDKKQNECNSIISPLLRSFHHDYCTRLMIDCIDIYMDKNRKWGREFCIKWDLDENANLLKKLDKLRPLIDDIIAKTRLEGFAFGIKKNGAWVVPCDCVNAR